MKSRRKAIKSITHSKIVSIGDYRNIRQGREQQTLALISRDPDLIQKLEQGVSKTLDLKVFDSRFSFEQALKSKEWDAVILDERELKDEALQLCEKLKRQNKMDDLVVIIVSNDSSKDRVRAGLELGCDEWLTRLEDAQSLARLVDHHLNFRF